MTSADIGPSTKDAISVTTSLKSLPSLLISEELVVTPSHSPRSLILFIWSTFAISKKNFILPPYRRKLMQFYNFALIFIIKVSLDKISVILSAISFTLNPLAS